MKIKRDIEFVSVHSDLLFDKKTISLSVYRKCFLYVIDFAAFRECFGATYSKPLLSPRLVFRKMVNEMQELDDFEDVEYREHEKKVPCSVSGYGDLQSKSAHDALLQASRDLLPLADYIEQNYSPDVNKDLNRVLNGCEG